MIGANPGPMKECGLERYAAGAVPGRGAVVGHRTPPIHWKAGSTVGPPGVLRDWEQWKRGAGVWYERMRGRAVGLLSLLLLFSLDLRLLDDGRGASGSASSTGQGIYDWLPPLVAVGDGRWWCC